MDPQQQLSRALETRKLEDFENALRSNANPNLADENGITIYEKVLSTAGSAGFIRLCLRYGCSPYYVSAKNKAAINFACDSRVSANIKCLLQHRGINVDHKYNELTPLNSLAKNLTSSNSLEIIKCMKLLLQYGASPNLTDDNDMSPLHYILFNISIEESQKQELIELFLQQNDIDLDVGDGELRQELLEWNPNLLLPSSSTSIPGSTDVNLHQLKRELRTGHEQEFLKLLKLYKGNDTLELVADCIKTGSHKAFDELLEIGCDINKIPQGYKTTFVEISIIFGNWYTLEKLLFHKDVKLPNDLELLNLVIGRLDERPLKSYCDYTKCFDVLMASSQVDVNETDKSGRTPLHYAIIYNHDQAVRMLLRRGAYMGMRSKFKELAVQDIPPYLLEEHFNDCVSSNLRNRADKSFQLTLNYNTLKLRPHLKLGARNEMEPISAIARSKELRHLLNHPLITTVIMLKWESLSLFFYSFFLTSLLFSFFLIAHIFLIFSHRNDDLLMYTNILSWLSISYFTVCELVKLVLTRVLWPMDRVLNITLIALTVFTNLTCNPNQEIYYSRIIASFAILLLALKLTQLIGSLPIYSLSTHVLMLREVCYTFLKSCIPYSILVMSFGLSFYILDFHHLSEKPIFEAIIKTIIMSTGEFDESDLKYQDLFFGYLFFFIFVIFISIVLMNLLSALAFSDTQAIQATAEVNSLICLVDLLNSYEIFTTGSFRNHLYRFIKIQIAPIPASIIAFPNDEEITSTSSDPSENSVEMQQLMQKENEHGLNNHKINIPEAGAVMKLKNKTVKQILQIIDVKSNAQRNRQLKEIKAKQLENIEEMLRNRDGVSKRYM